MKVKRKQSSCFLKKNDEIIETVQKKGVLQKKNTFSKSIRYEKQTHPSEHSLFYSDYSEFFSSYFLRNQMRAFVRFTSFIFVVSITRKLPDTNLNM